MRFVWITVNFRLRRGRSSGACTIPGVSYTRRKVARDGQSKVQRLTQPYVLARIGRRLAAAQYRTTGWRLPNRWSIDFGRTLHHAIIARSQAAYTEGSAYDYPVRKFIEIPAQRTLLMCTPHPGFEDRGFREGETHIEGAPEDVTRSVRTFDFGSAAVRDYRAAGIRHGTAPASR